MKKINIELTIRTISASLISIKWHFEKNKEIYDILKLLIEDIKRCKTLQEVKGYLEDMLDDVAHDEAAYEAVAKIYQSIEEK